MSSPRCISHRLGEHKVVPQAVAAVLPVQNLLLCQQHQVLFPELHGPDGLGEAKTTAVLDIVHVDVDPWGARQSTLQRQRRYVESASAMAERDIEADRHYTGPAPPPTRGTRNLENCTVSPPIELTAVRGPRGLKKCS